MTLASYEVRLKELEAGLPELYEGEMLLIRAVICKITQCSSAAEGRG